MTLIGLLSELQPGVYVLLSMLILLATVGVIVLLFFGIRRERMRFTESVIDKEINTLASLEKYIHQSILSRKKKNTFALYLVSLTSFEEVKKILGAVQYQNLLNRICDILSKLQSWGNKVSVRNDDNILVYLRGNSFDLEQISQLIVNNISKNESLKTLMNIDVDVNVACVTYPSAGDSLQKLLEHLDLTMIVSRRRGANNYAVYNPEMAAKESSEYKYYQEIKDAMKAKEFTLFYHPIVDTSTMDVVSCESLIRWKHKMLGILPPAQFLYIMEQTGDINWVGFWCFEQGVKQLSQWLTNYENHFTMSTNISERQLMNPEFADELRKIVRKYKANPANFIMEISNFSLYFSSETAKQNFDKLHEYGFKITFDGFGTEYSSPVMLEQLPVDIIKLDKTFWKKAQQSDLTGDTIDVLVKHCKSKGKNIIAQNVENADDVLFLQKHGITNMQGYVFSQPHEARDFISDVLLTPWSENLKESLNPNQLGKPPKSEAILKATATLESKKDTPPEDLTDEEK